MRTLNVTNNKFEQKNFTYDGMYLHYNVPCEDASGNYCYVTRFVARFKSGGMVAFKKFLRNNFTVNEYFKLLDKDLAPLKALETKGYVSPKVCNVLKTAGYPLTLAGKKAYIEDVVAARTPDVNRGWGAITITESGK